MRGTYSRWTETQTGVLEADILGEDVAITANSDTGRVGVCVPDRPISPDEARMIGVRLIEAAALADGDRAIRGRD